MGTRMRKKKISFFVHDLSDNPIVRVAPLAGSLIDTHDIEILGFLFNGRDVYAPYRGLFQYKTLSCSLSIQSVFSALPRLASMATGDIVYACKPRLASFGPALWASGFGHRKPLFLDVEDDELAVPINSQGLKFLWEHGVKGWRHATAWKYAVALHPFTMFAKKISVISSKLQKRYGGVIVLNGPNETLFDPTRFPVEARRAERLHFGLPTDEYVALFAGVPRPHKGWQTLLAALTMPQARTWHLALAGDPEHDEFKRAKQELGQRCHIVGLLPYEGIPSLLAAVDAVAVPQLRTPFSETQIPAKALEAMAMEKAVLASRLGDLPAVLGDGERGWLVEPGSAGSLADALADVAANPAEVSRRGRSAREWYLTEASFAATRHRLLSILS